MSELIAVAGDTGTGKSTSIKYLDPKETYVINVANKALPFKGSGSLYNKENKNFANIDVATEVLSKLIKISVNAPHIKQVIIDDCNYLMGFNLIKKASEVGYTKFNMMAKDMTNLLLEAKKLRNDLIIYYFTHTEEINDGENLIGYKIKTAGKVLDNQIKLEGLFTVVLYTEVIEGKNGQMEYKFITNRYGKLPAKSPQGMFDDIKIDNNLQYVTDKIKEYYK